MLLGNDLLPEILRMVRLEIGLFPTSLLAITDIVNGAHTSGKRSEVRNEDWVLTLRTDPVTSVMFTSYVVLHLPITS